MKVSVVVPVYNVEPYLDKCLNSLLNQSFEDFEVIIVNDGSPDNSSLIIEKYVELNPKIFKAFTKKNGGLSDARNYGLKHIKGKYVTFVDSDDYVEKDYLRKLYNKIDNENLDIVACGMKEITPHGEKIFLESINSINEYLINLPAAWNKIFRCSFLKLVDFQFKKGIYYEDLEAIIPLGFEDAKISSINDVLYNYVKRENSITTQKKYNPKMDSIYIVIDSIIKKSEKKKVYDKYVSEIEWITISRLFHDFGLVFLNYKESLPNLKKSKEYLNYHFPKWYKNKYFKNQNVKYKIVVYLLYFNCTSVLRMYYKYKGNKI